MQLGFIGTGEITASIVKGLCLSGATACSIWLSPRNSAMANALANRFQGVSVASTNQEVVDRSEIVVIAVRPPVAASVLSELRFRPEQCVISLVSAFPLRNLTQLLMPVSRIVRAVPLPSTAMGIGPTAIYPADPVSSEIFAKVGTVFAVASEHEFNAICTATATIATHLLSRTELVSGWRCRVFLNQRPETTLPAFSWASPPALSMSHTAVSIHSRRLTRPLEE